MLFCFHPFILPAAVQISKTNCVGENRGARVLARLFKRLPDLRRAAQAVGGSFKKPLLAKTCPFKKAEFIRPRRKKAMSNQRLEYAEPKGRGNLLGRFTASELGEWGTRQFMDHLGTCEFCRREVMIHFLEPVIPTLPLAERLVLEVAVRQWRQADA
jgi:hypothetical protein